MAEKPVSEKKYVKLGGLPWGTTDDGASDAQKIGGKVIGQEEAQASEQALQNKVYVDENWGTTGKVAAGLASGLTLGIGPGIAAATGLVDPGHLEAAQETGAYMGGDVAGTMLPALLTGGEGLAGRSAIGKALRYGTPAGLMEVGGSAAERLMGGVLGEQAGVLGRLAATPAKMAARGAFEGAAVNLGHTVGDSLIQNKPLSAEALLAAGVDGALFGGLIGGSFGTVGALAGQAIESVGAIGKSAVSKSGLREGIAFRRLGATAEDVQVIEQKFGSRSAGLKEIGETLKEGGTRVGASDKEIMLGLSKVKEIHTTSLADVAKQLDAQAPMSTPSLPRLFKRWDTEVVAQAVGTQGEAKVAEIVEGLKNRFSSITSPGINIPTTPGKVPTNFGVKANTWDAWLKSSNQLRDELGDILSKQFDPNPNRLASQKLKVDLLNVVDSEIRAAMEGAGKMPGMEGIAEKYAASHTKLKIAEQIEESLGKKSAEALLKTESSITPRDLGLAGAAAVGGNPLTGLAWLAGKGVAKQLSARFEPALAQMAFDASVGTKALGATQSAQGRISKSLGKVFSNASKSTTKVTSSVRSQTKAKAKGEQVTRERYEEMASRTEQLLSNNHQDKVRRYAEMIHDQGYQDFANQLMLTNNRAVQYLIWNAPPRAGAKGMNSLRPMPASKVPTLQEYKYYRIQKAISQPFTLLEDMEKGTMSRDAVQAVKYVYPEIHAQIVEQASTKIYEMKSEGKFLPMSQIANLGVALDAPIDSTLTTEFVGAVQSALAAAPTQPADQGPAPQSMPIADQGLLTPLQKLTT